MREEASLPPPLFLFSSSSPSVCLLPTFLWIQSIALVSLYLVPSYRATHTYYVCVWKRGEVTDFLGKYTFFSSSFFVLFWLLTCPFLLSSSFSSSSTAISIAAKCFWCLCQPPPSILSTCHDSFLAWVVVVPEHWKRGERTGESSGALRVQRSKNIDTER